MKWTIYQNGETINAIEASVEFVENYCEENGYTYELIEEPEPTPEPPEPTEEDDVNAMLVDHEYRLTLLELGITEEV